VGAIGTSRSAAAGLAVVSAGIVADRLGGDAVVAAAGIVGLVCAVAYAAFHVPPIGPAPRFSARESVRTLRTRPALSRIVLAQGFYGGGFIAAAPLFALVYVDRLGLSLAEVGLVGILTAAATTFSFYAWGAVADRLGPTAVLRAGSAIGLAGLVAYATAPGVVVLFLGAVAIGAANASIDTGIASAVSNETSLETRSAAMAGWNALTGMRGIAAPFAISGLVQLGVLDVSSGLLWCGIICSIGVALYARAHSLRYEPAKPATARAPTGALEPA
ncbi:MAG: MFS transporter, partial [Chloroflexota bacterium]